MNCKHCENEIKDDSKFCSFCGERIETNFEKINDPSDTIVKKDKNPKYLRIDNGYAILGLVFGLYFLQNQLRFFFEGILREGTTNIFTYIFLGIPLIIASIPILMSWYTTVKSEKTILRIIGLMFVFIGLYTHEMSTPIWLGIVLSWFGIILYMSPFLFFIVLLRKTESKTFGEILILNIITTSYGLALAFSSFEQVLGSEGQGELHLAFIIIYPIVNLIIGLKYRHKGQSSIIS